MILAEAYLVIQQNNRVKIDWLNNLHSHFKRILLTIKFMKFIILMELIKWWEDQVL